MKRKNGPAVDLKAFLERAAAKKRQTENQSNQLQLVVFQGQSDSGTNMPSEPEVQIPETERAASTKPDIGGTSEDNESDDESGDEYDDDGNYDIEHDPGLRTPISGYAVNDQDSVRRAYIALGPCRPKMKKEDFPQHMCGGMRRFQPKWFDEFKWLEYSVDRDGAYCFVCYLFKDTNKFTGGDSFVNGGFRNWNMKARFRKHAGEINSANSEAEEKHNMFITPKASISPLPQAMHNSRLSIWLA
uniref:Uncharacterized protein n=1 Tax=Avena sativa TaxID=4498 RepID=A0ACD5XEW3_AVESA